LNIGLLGRWRDWKILDPGFHPLLALLDEHHRDIVSNGILPVAIRLLAYQPATVD
jgi:hypothetical protein